MNLEAVNQFVGTAWEYGSNDCWAVFCKASAAVFGRAVPTIAVPDVPNPLTNCALFTRAALRPEWHPVEKPTPGCAVLFKDRKGRPVHVGLYVTGGNVLHCPGSPTRPGRTQYDPLRVLREVYREIEFYMYVPDNVNQ